MNETKWTLEGLDAFDGGRYFLSRHHSEDEALRAAQIRLSFLEKTQPTASSGGQAEHGIQDRVFVVLPDGTRRRVLPDAGFLADRPLSCK